MSNKTLIAIGAGVICAFAATAFMNQTPGAFILVYMANLPLFLTGFAFGPQSALISGAAGFLIVGMLGGGVAAGIFALLQVIPTWLVVRLMLLQRPIDTSVDYGTTNTSKNNIDWYPAGDMVCWLSLLVAGIFLVATFGSLSSGHESLSGLIADNLDRILQTMAPDWDPGQRAQIVDLMVPMFPGAMGISWLIMIIINGVIAQNVLCKFKKAIRPAPSYIDLNLPSWISWPLVASCTMALLGSGELEYTGRNLAMILSLPFFFLGLAVVHTWARRLQSGSAILLVFFYFVLILSNWTAILVAGIGLIELWNGIRIRLVDNPRINN
jgi:hypothetical protein